MTPFKGEKEQMNEEGQGGRGLQRRNIVGTKATTRIRCQEDPTPSLMSQSRARDGERPCLNHRPQGQALEIREGPGAYGATEEGQKDIIRFGKKTKGKVSQVHGTTTSLLGDGASLSSQPHSSQPP